MEQARKDSHHASNDLNQKRMDIKKIHLTIKKKKHCFRAKTADLFFQVKAFGGKVKSI